MEFQTEWNRKKVPTNPGDDLLPQYIESVDKNGKTYLKKTGDKNIFNEIQEAAIGTTIYEIYDKYLQTGDESLLEQRKGLFADFTKIPTNPAEIHKMIIEADGTFNQLDKEVRELFENDVGIFKQSVLDGTFEDKIAHMIGEKTKAEKAAEIEAQIKEEEKKNE